jgi:hypothetical protein
MVATGRRRSPPVATGRRRSPAVALAVTLTKRRRASPEEPGPGPANGADVIGGGGADVIGGGGGANPGREGPEG